MTAVHHLENLDNRQIIERLGKDAKAASRVLAQTPTDKINAVLQSLSDALIENTAQIIDANAQDIAAAKERGLSDAMVDRLMLDGDRIKGIAAGVLTVMALDDPTGKKLWQNTNPKNQLNIERVSCPIGVLGMIYESRPNVTVDASILCLKSHNAVILRGGSESLNSSLALHKIVQDCLDQHGLPKAAVSMVPTKDREAVGEMLRASDYIDVMIPRGGRGLIERVMNDARMPVFSHLDGLCHIFVDESADHTIAKDVTLNAKMRRTGICGAMETLLLHSALDETLVKDILNNLIDSGCEIRGDERVCQLETRAIAATQEDWTTEYLEAKLSVRFVSDIHEAIEHINENGSHHTDSILSEHDENVAYFLNNVDSGIVMHNTSTQFADGGEFGMGAEIGIATGKMHARGPVGLEQLCTYKYLVHGKGQTRP